MADQNSFSLPSKRLRHIVFICFALYMLLSGVVLFGVTGHYETTPGGAAIADQVFKAAMVILALHPVFVLAPVVFFSFQFLKVVTEALGTVKDNTDSVLEHAQITLIIGKVPCALSFCAYPSFTTFSASLDSQDIVHCPVHWVHVASPESPHGLL